MKFNHMLLIFGYIQYSRKRLSKLHWKLSVTLAKYQKKKNFKSKLWGMLRSVVVKNGWIYTLDVNLTHSNEGLK